MFLTSSLFRQFDDLIFGFSTKYFNHKQSPFFSNMSFEIGDSDERVWENRRIFTKYLQIDLAQVAYQHQIHSDTVTLVKKPGFIGDSDAMITNQMNIALAVGSADCTTVFIYDYKKKIIAAIHSGWQGTQKRIVEKTIERMEKDFNSAVKECFVFIAPAISVNNYEVGKEFLNKFDKKYFLHKDGKIYLDVSRANFDMLIKNGVPESQIQLSRLCSYQNKNLFHSYRHDKENSGRAWGLIMMRQHE